MGLRSAHEGDDEIVSLDECPAAVQATIRAHLNGGALKEIERTTDHGEVLYEVDVQHADGIVEFDVAEDGVFRGLEENAAEGGRGALQEGADDDSEDDGEAEGGDGEEEEIPLSDVPDVVKNAAIAAVPGLVLQEASRETEDGVVIYDLEGEANGVEYEVEVAADGTVNEIETDEADDDEDEDEEDDGN